MVEEFRLQFRECLKEYHAEIAGSPLLLSLLEPLYALADKTVYDAWIIGSDLRSHEVSNLIACMQQSEDRDTLKDLGKDLEAEGYESRRASDLDEIRTSSELNVIEAITEGKAATLIAMIMEAGREG